MDCFGGVLTVSVGHAAARVNRAWIDQVNTIAPTSSSMPTGRRATWRKSWPRYPPGGEKSFFTNRAPRPTIPPFSRPNWPRGAMRCRFAAQLCRALRDGALTIGHSTWKRSRPQQAGFVHAHAPYCYRCPFNATPDNCGLACANDMRS